MVDLLKEINLGVTEKFEKEVLKREQLQITLNEVINNPEILNKNKVYILKEGVLLHVNNDSFRLFFYKNTNRLYGNYSNVYFYELLNAKKGDAKYSSSVAYKIMGKTDQDYEKDFKKENNHQMSTNKKQGKTSYIDIYCWECGNLLDINGNCDVCGCSKEIF